MLVALGFMTVYVGFMQVVPSLTVPVEGTVIAVRPAAQANRNPKAEFRFVTPDGVRRTAEAHVTGGARVVPGDSLALGVLPHWPHFTYTQDHLRRQKDNRLTFVLIWFGALLAALTVRGISRRMAATF